MNSESVYQHVHFQWFDFQSYCALSSEFISTQFDAIIISHLFKKKKHTHTLTLQCKRRQCSWLAVASNIMFHCKDPGSASVCTTEVYFLYTLEPFTEAFSRRWPSFFQAQWKKENYLLMVLFRILNRKKSHYSDLNSYKKKVRIMSLGWNFEKNISDLWPKHASKNFSSCWLRRWNTRKIRGYVLD